MSTQLIVPARIKREDAIGFVSPSAGPHPSAMHRIDQAKTTLEKLGYRVKYGTHALQSAGSVSGTVEERVADLHDMFLDPDIKMIMCTIGGNDSNQLLKYLDYSLIKNNPKIFIGYSDITVLHYAIQSQAGLATYYGPCAMTQFGEYPEILEYSLRYFEQETGDGHDAQYDLPASVQWTDEFLDWFKKQDCTRARTLKSNSGYEWIGEGTAEGPALGGAILSVNHLAGTKYWLDAAGTIFFIDILKENDLLNEGAVLSLLTDLDNIGVFEKINGLVVSRPAGFSDEETLRLKSKIVSFFKNKKCPILFNANIGHTDPIATIRYGRLVRLDSSRNTVTML